ncbi:MAG: AbrB/MazE/SpoVT family DNA-binding domain-containing protein [Balneolaceae bacterium]|nr:MAG: AbrB/MazE/SpoVT family DNA-binding domain-containing protein [Balneolaceae bacterium]
MEAKIRRIGNSSGIILPKEVMEELNLKEGDILTIERKGTSLELRSEDPEFAEWAEAYRSANMEYKEVLKELAK